MLSLGHTASNWFSGCYSIESPWSCGQLMSCPVEDGYYLLHSVPRLGKVNDSRGVRVSLTCTPVLMRLLGKYLPVKILDSGWDHPLPAPFNVIRGSLTINTFVKYNVNFFRSATPPLTTDRLACFIILRLVLVRIPCELERGGLGCPRWYLVYL